MREEGGPGRKEHRGEERPPHPHPHTQNGTSKSAHQVALQRQMHFQQASPITPGAPLLRRDEPGGAGEASWFPQLSPPPSASVAGRGALGGKARSCGSRHCHQGGCPVPATTMLALISGLWAGSAPSSGRRRWSWCSGAAVLEQVHLPHCPHGECPPAHPPGRPPSMPPKRGKGEGEGWACQSLAGARLGQLLKKCLIGSTKML